MTARSYRTAEWEEIGLRSGSMTGRDRSMRPGYMLLGYMLLFVAFMSVTLPVMAEDAPLSGGVRGGMEDVVLVGADDWHASMAATPLAIWSEGNHTTTTPLLILPRSVDAGDRTGWIEEGDLERYGAIAILNTFKSANISAITVHGQGDEVKAMVQAAHKDGLKVYITATLEIPHVSEKAGLDKINEIGEAGEAMLAEAGITSNVYDTSHIDKSLMQVANPDIGGNASLFCPANSEVRESLYSQIETLIDDYQADGIVLYNIGFQDENFCYCNACKEKFYQDTGLDLSKANSNSFNQERWRQWKEDQIMQIVAYARNITSDLGPVKLGMALDSPFDRNHGYNFAEMAKLTDFSIISPLSAQDAGQAAHISDRPVYIRLSDDYLEYVLSTQNVEGGVAYIEGLISSGAAGVAFEYSVVTTPVWSELLPPSGASRWLLQQIGGSSLAIGDVSWKSEERLIANNSFDLAEKISRYWESSPGAVIAEDSYSSALTAAPIASYLNWPLLYAGKSLSNETAAAIERLGAARAVLVGPVSQEVKEELGRMNITIMEGDTELLLEQMKKRGDSPNMVVYTNSHDFSLLPPSAEPVVDRTFVDDLLIRTEMSPSRIPAEEAGETVRLNFSLTNTGEDTLRDVRLLDIFPLGRYIKWPRSEEGEINVTDPYSGGPSDAFNAFFNGTMLRWNLNKLEPGKSASLNVDVQVLYPLDSGWHERLDTGATAAYEGFSYNHTLENLDEEPVINLTYPIWIYAGRTNITWNLNREASYTQFNLYSPDSRSATVRITDIQPDKLYEVRAQMLIPGKWTFNIETGNGYTHRTKNYTIQVRSNVEAMNISAFSHTKVPRLSLVAAPAAAARRALLFDVAVDPQNIDPVNLEQKQREKVEELGIDPQYLMVVGDPGSMPFISTGLRQKATEVTEYEIFRDYQLPLEDENYSSVAVGRIMGLSVYDASQLLARTIAYDRLNGSWKDNALVISSPPLSYPQTPTSVAIRDYLAEAGLDVKDLRYEQATYQQAVSQMNNGQNIVSFIHHGDESSWQLSDWSMMDSSLTAAHVKQLTLSPQTTTSGACVTVNLKGYYLNVTGTRMYVPASLDDSIALAFIRAGAVNYVGDSTLSWIFLSEDFFKRFYQSLVFEGSSVGKAALDADNLYRLKFQGAEKIKDISDYDEPLPEWDVSVPEMLNQTAYMNVILGDPSFKPKMPDRPALPYTTRIIADGEEGGLEGSAVLAGQGNASASNNASAGGNMSGGNVSQTNSISGGKSGEMSRILASITADNESATDWIYWIETDSSSGSLDLNAPPAIIAEVLLPRDADKITVKDEESDLAVWHDEYIRGIDKHVMWPVIKPRLSEERSYLIEYEIIPGQVQRINVTDGWNAVAVYLQPKDASAGKYLRNKPYRSMFTITGQEWDFGMKDGGTVNVTAFKPGEGYLIDSAGNFTIEIPGKPVDLPYRLDLHSGWNMVGLPVNKTVDRGNITVNAEHKRYRYPEAAEKGLVSAFIWKYEGDSWIHLSENETLIPGVAYLFEATGEAKLEFR
ncbi:MAG TPA: C25 family cysteine peptidase [Methanothrix sp.]|nr:C25 family cysteine peptidase [Methanothrix sp.]